MIICFLFIQVFSNLPLNRKQRLLQQNTQPNWFSQSNCDIAVNIKTDNDVELPHSTFKVGSVCLWVIWINILSCTNKGCVSLHLLLRRPSFIPVQMVKIVIVKYMHTIISLQCKSINYRKVIEFKSCVS